MNNLTVFNNKDFGQVRSIVIKGEPWFVANDICSALGYEKARNAVAQHVDKDDALKRGVTDRLGRVQETLTVNESGLYALIFGSKLDSAKAFKKWVTLEVLPSIRKTGKYETDALKQQRVERATNVVLSSYLCAVGENKFAFKLNFKRLCNRFQFCDGKVIP